ncbi:hypothetical protein A2U01_0002320 [Trifolium medium]|uniref:Uncharacterized protein n=1 Tax=Trifolium medium TaxID=97028 RepID=A0A392M2N7_9FABA|nr:hypothetical protein [Trifolium medium]
MSSRTSDPFSHVDGLDSLETIGIVKQMMKLNEQIMKLNKHLLQLDERG